MAQSFEERERQFPIVLAAGPDEVRVLISEDSDVVTARKQARKVAQQAGLSQIARESLAVAISEIAQNIVVHAGQGEISIFMVKEPGRDGVAAVAVDDGPGIPDVGLALEDGYSTAHGLGLGLSSAKRLMDEFAIVSASGRGTIVIMKKWVHGSK